MIINHLYAFSNKDKLNKFIETNYVFEKMILPDTEWLMPTEYPDLRSYPEIAIDLETRDPELKSKGSGSVIGMGEIVVRCSCRWL